MELPIENLVLPVLRLPGGVHPDESRWAPSRAIVRAIASRTAGTKPELAQVTGLSRTTVAAHVHHLVGGQVLTSVTAPPAAGRGRPAEHLAITPRAGLVAALDVGVSRTRIALADLNQRLHAVEQIDMDLSDGPEAVILRLRERVFAMLKSRPGAPLLAAVLGLPARIDSSNGVAVRPSALPGWDGYPLLTELSEHLGVSAVIDNDVNLRALGESAILPRDQVPLIAVKVGAALAAGIVDHRGNLFRGYDGGAGDIGHIPLRHAPDRACNCGRFGCLEATASTTSMYAAVTGAASVRPGEDRALFRLLQERDTRAEAAVRTAGEALGEVLVGLCNALNPRRIVIGGEITAYTDELLAAVRGAVYQAARPLATRNLSIEHATLRERGGLAGALILGIELAVDQLAPGIQ